MVTKKQMDKSWKKREKIIKIIEKEEILFLDLNHLLGFIQAKIDLYPKKKIEKEDKTLKQKERKR